MATQFTSTLSLGSYGPQVKALQQWLNANGSPVAAAGLPGGPGTETENFGPATLAAVQKWQAANGIVSSGTPETTGYGNFGPKTMAAVNTKIAAAPVVTIQNDGSSSVSAPPTTSSNPTNDYTVQPQHVVNDGAGTAYFSNGNDALVTIAGQGYAPQQIFLVDQTNKQLIPFSSMQSAVNYFTTVTGSQVTPEQINSVLTQVPSSVLSQGGSLAGFVPVQSANGFDDQGRLVNPAPSNANIQARYNKNVDQNAEVKAYTALDGFAKLLQNAGVGSTVTSQEISKLIGDKTIMGFYINALAYGGYSLQDVYQDMIRRQAIDTGKGDLVMNSFPISTSMDAATYKATANYSSVKANPTLNVSPSIAGIDSSMLNNPVLQLPDTAFNLISPLGNPDSPEFRALMEQYKSATYQTALEMSQADNETDHARALADWKTLQGEIQNRLGITLSDNAIQAWNQIDNFTAQAGQANLGGSGMAQQKVDEFLRQQMGANQSMRKAYASDEERTKENYYQNFASPDEIRDFIVSDPKKAEEWGLVPSAETKAYMTIGNLQSLFPDTPKEDLQAIINKFMDVNGNRYSKLYGSYAANKYDITGMQNVASATDVMQASQDKATEALSQFSDPNNPFLKKEGNITTPNLPSTNTAVTPQSADTMKAIQGAAKNLGTTAPETPTTPKAPPAPTPPSNMTSVQQTAWDNAIAQIPKPAAPKIDPTIASFNQQMVNTKPVTTNSQPPTPTPTPVKPPAPTPPPNMTAAQQKAWNAAIALIPK